MKRLIVLIVSLILLTTNLSFGQWYQVTNGKTIGCADIAFADGQYGVATTGLGFYTTTDGGTTWKIYADWNYIWMSFWSVEFSNDKTGWILGYDNQNSYLVKTTDAGLSWNNVNIPLSNSTMYKMHWLDENNGYICGGTKGLVDYGDTTGVNAGIFWKTTDAGLTWSAINVGKPVWGWQDVVILSNGVGYLIGIDEIYKTNDYGNVWNKISFSTHNDEYLRSVVFVNNNVGYLIGFGTGSIKNTWVYKTTNGGNSWVLQGEIPNYVVAFYNPMCVLDESSLILSGVSYSTLSMEVKRTHDSGLNWITDYSIELSLPSQIQSVKKIGRTIWGAGSQIHKCDNLPPYFSLSVSDSVALIGSDYKQTISVKDPDGDLVSLQLLQPNFLTIEDTTITGKPTSADSGEYEVKVLASDGHGGIDTLCYKLTVTSTVGVEDENSIPTKYQLSQNYPNPFNPTTTINYSLPKSGNVKIMVVNSLGQEVSILVDEFKSVGSHSVQFSASNLPSGIYFYRIVADSYTNTKKMILIK